MWRYKRYRRLRDGVSCWILGRDPVEEESGARCGAEISLPFLVDHFALDKLLSE